MAKNRYIDTQFWDKKYIRSLKPHGKLLYLYLFTNSLATIAGAYEITEERIAFDTGLSIDEIREWMATFAKDDKAHYTDEWMLTLNTIKHQTLTNGKIRIGIEELVKCCPDWVKDRLSIRYEWLSHLNTNSNLNSNSNLTEAPRAVTDQPKPTRRNGSRLPDGFSLSNEMIDWAKDNCPGVSPALETEKFKDHWKSAARNATKLDWVAAWRLWMRNARDWSKQNGSNKFDSNKTPVSTAPVKEFGYGERIT